MFITALDDLTVLHLKVSAIPMNELCFRFARRADNSLLVYMEHNPFALNESDQLTGATLTRKKFKKTFRSLENKPEKLLLYGNKFW